MDKKIEFDDDFCVNISRNPDRKIPNEHLIELIERNISSSSSVILIGEELSGKSVIASDFYRKNSKSTIGLFLGADLFSRSKDYVRLIVADQISWIVNGKPLNVDHVGEQDFSSYIYQLQKFSRRTKINWVIDGLFSKYRKDDKVVDALLSMLPLGYKDFNFIITSDHEVLERFTDLKLNPKTIHVPSVSVDEVRNYLDDFSLDEKDKQEIRSMCGGVVGHISIIRSLLEDGQDIESILVKENKSIDLLLEKEWVEVEANNSLKRVVSQVVFSDYKIDIKRLSQLLAISDEAILNVVRDSKIIYINDSNGALSIKSGAHLRLAKKKLADLETVVREINIDFFIKNIDSSDSVRYLPEQLGKHGLNDQVLDRLNKDHFSRLLKIEQTLHALKQHAIYGCNAARSLSDVEHEIAFSVLSSALTELTLTVGKLEQIEALSRRGQEENALEIAATAPTSEERLQLMARSINLLDTKGYVVSEDIKKQVIELSEEVKCDDLGELGIDIACDLLSVDFKVAENFLNKVLDNASRRRIAQRKREEENSSLQSSDVDKSKIFWSQASGEIPMHKRQMFWEQATRKLEKTSFEQLNLQVAESHVEDAFVLCIVWLGGNKKNENNYKVAEKALDLMISISSRTPKIRDLIEIAKILPSIISEDKRIILCDRVETQFRVLKHLGTSVESIRLRMLVLRARYRFAKEEVELNLLDIFIEIQSIKDVSTRSACWCWFLYSLSVYENAEGLERSTELIRLSKDELIDTHKTLINGVADHFFATKDALVALSKFDADLALELISKLNTAISRDRSYELLVQLFLKEHLQNSIHIKKCVDSIEDSLIKSRVCVDALLRIRRVWDLNINRDVPHDLILNLWKSIDVEIFKFQAIQVASAFYLDKGNFDKVEELKNISSEIWNSRVNNHSKIELGYLSAKEFADVDRKLSDEWLERTNSFQAGCEVASEAANYSLYMIALLATRLLPSLLVDSSLEEAVALVRRTANIINSIKIEDFQVVLWSGVAINLFFLKSTEKSKEIVFDYIKPLIDEISQNNPYLKNSSIERAASAFYLVHPQTAKMMIESVGCPVSRDRARYNIVISLMQRAPFWEPYSEGKDCDYVLTQESVSEVLDVLDSITFDGFIFEIVRDLSKSLCSERNKAKIQRNFAMDCLVRIEKIIKKSLPDKMNISHDGYSIVCEAFVSGARSKISNPSKSDGLLIWDGLYERARKIENHADRAIVTAFVCVNAKIYPEGKIQSWMSEISSDLELIPSSNERLGRYEWIAKVVYERDRVGARKLISDAITLSNQLRNTEDVTKSQQQLLDFANSIDASFSKELLEILDTDEARKKIIKKSFAKDESKKLIAATPASNDVDELTDDDLLDICGKNMASLMSDRINSKPLNEFLNISHRARYMPIRDSIKIWDFVYENNNRMRNTGAKYRSQSTLKLFEATCDVAEISLGLIGRVIGIPVSKSNEVSLGNVDVGERDELFSWVQQWLQDYDGDEIIITDPYFSPKDINFIKMMHHAVPKSAIKILTSKEQMKKVDDPENAFYEAWKAVSDLNPPNIRIGIVGYGSEGKHPIHDRWLVSKKKGLRFGSSINGIGLSRVSDISEIEGEESITKFNLIAQYFGEFPRVHAGQRVSALSFVL